MAVGGRLRNWSAQDMSIVTRRAHCAAWPCAWSIRPIRRNNMRPPVGVDVLRAATHLRRTRCYAVEPQHQSQPGSQARRSSRLVGPLCCTAWALSTVVSDSDCSQAGRTGIGWRSRWLASIPSHAPPLRRGALRLQRARAHAAVALRKCAAAWPGNGTGSATAECLDRSRYLPVRRRRS